MDENIGNIPGENTAASEPGGISFSGGSENAFIKEYASSPKVERTVEEIEREEQKAAEKQARIHEKNVRRRESLERKKKANPYSSAVMKAEEAAKEPAEEPEAPVGASQDTQKFSFDQELFREESAAAQTASEQRLSRDQLVTPVAEDEPEEAKADAPEEKKPLSKFRRAFSSSKGFSVYSLITGIILAGWNILYIVTVYTREALFNQAVKAMAAQGTTDYTVQFSSPALTILKLIAYFIPAVVLAWGIVFKVTDGKNHSYNKKTIIAIMCLIAVACIIAVFDIAKAHLVMT
ncbi:MAG: hypothetical protein IJS90_06985 [Clostridia bacterium]|nr:hypothetical protein [Clostridia bacterium]